LPKKKVLFYHGNTQKFESSEEVITATEAYFADLEKTYFSDGLEKLEHCWVMCIMLKGDYVEK
jgi:hypothetical protein